MIYRKFKAGYLALAFLLVAALLQPTGPIYASLNELPSSHYGTIKDTRQHELAPGASYTWYAMDSDRGKQKIHFVEFDPTSANLKLQAGTKDGYVYGMKTVSEMAAYTDAPGNRVIAGINADFFEISGNKTGVPNGLFMADGRILNSTISSYAFGLKADGTSVYGKPGLQKFVSINGATTELTHINRYRSDNQLVLYTTDYSPTTRTSNEGDELLLMIKEGAVKNNETVVFEVLEKVIGKGNTSIAEGQAVLSASGTMRSLFSELEAGDELTASFSLDSSWDGVEVAVGGQGPLVKDGVVQTTVGPAGVHPRTAIGTKQDGSIVLFEIDGRAPGFSEGVETAELAQILADIGVVNAMNLDGGGSSTLIAKLPGSDKAHMLNRGSDGAERQTGNSLLLINTGPELGVASHIALQPSTERVLTGSSLSFSAYGMDANGHPAPLTDALSWEADEQLGVINADGRLLAGDQAATGIVQVSTGSITGTASIEVVSQIDQLILPDASRSFSSGDAWKLSVTAMRAGQEVQADNHLFAWHTEGDIGTITEEGMFKATDNNGAVGKIVVSYGGVSTSMDVSVGLPPVLLEDFENGLDKYLKTSGAQYKFVQISSEANPDFVRSGNHSLKLEYDFTGTTGTSGAYLTATNTENRLHVEGYPEKISLWVYGDGKKHWLRGQFRDGDNKAFAVDYTDASVGVDWVGWKYVEVDVPKGRPLPLSMDMPVRYMETNNDNKNAGVIYIDDIRVLYGPSNDDITPPIIKQMKPEAGEIVKDAHPTISLIAEDDGYDPVTSPGTTLIDPASIRMYVDGELVDSGLYPPEGKITYKPVEPLEEGPHKVKIAVRDLSGNQTIKEWSFTVNLGSPYYTFTTPEEQYTGGTYTLDIHAEQVGTLSGGQIAFEFDKQAVEELVVIPGSKLQPEMLQADVAADGRQVKLSFQQLQQAALADGDLLGQISYKIKSDFIGPLRLEDLNKAVSKPHVINFVSGFIEKSEAGQNVSLPFYGTALTPQVKANLKLSWNHYAIGRGFPASFTITDMNDGSKIAGAELIIDGELLKQQASDENGLFETDQVTAQEKTYLVQAVKDGLYSPVMSFAVASPVFTATPVNISVSMGEKPEVSRRFNWHTHIDTLDTVVEYVKEDEFTSFDDEHVQRMEGKSELYNTHSYGTYRVHRAEVEGLEPGTAYIFRVGDGKEAVSATGRFVTSERSGDITKFVFIGDSQAGTEKDYDLWKQTIDAAINDVPDAEFVVHAGDMVDKGFRQEEWNWWFAAAQQHFMERTLITAIGNHEVMGTNGAGDYLAHFNHPAGGAQGVEGTSFSFDLKDTHFVLLNTELNEQTYINQAEWLEKDLAATDKKWKVLMFHQGPYGSVYANTRVQELWVPIFDKYNVDLVLNGHDHVYMRSYHMKGGEKAEQGTRYVIGGSSGPKFYGLNKRPWQEVVFDKTTNVYTAVGITKNEITIIAKTVDGEEVDRFTITKPVKVPNPIFPPVIPGGNANEDGAINLTEEHVQAVHENGEIVIESAEPLSRLVLSASTAQKLKAGQIIKIVASDKQVRIPAEAFLQLLKQLGEQNLQNHQLVFEAVHASEDKAASMLGKAASATGASLQAQSNVTTYRFKLDGESVKHVSYPITVSIELEKEDADGLTGMYKLSDNGVLTYVPSVVSGRLLKAQIEEDVQYVILKYDKQFDDLASTHWAGQVIKQLTAKQLLNGVSANRFAPEHQVTRAEFTAMIVRIMKQNKQGQSDNSAASEDAENKVKFEDVQKDKWYAADVAWAVQAGLINGKSSTKFAPEDSITRQEMAAILVRAMSQNQSATGKQAELSFSDIEQVPQWAKQAISEAVALGLMQGHSTERFAPTGMGTRAQSAQLMSNLLEALKK